MRTGVAILLGVAAFGGVVIVGSKLLAVPVAEPTAGQKFGTAVASIVDGVGGFLKLFSESSGPSATVSTTANDQDNPVLTHETPRAVRPVRAPALAGLWRAPGANEPFFKDLE